MRRPQAGLHPIAATLILFCSSMLITASTNAAPDQLSETEFESDVSSAGRTIDDFESYVEGIAYPSPFTLINGSFATDDPGVNPVRINQSVLPNFPQCGEPDENQCLSTVEIFDVRTFSGLPAGTTHWGVDLIKIFPNDTISVSAVGVSGELNFQTSESFIGLVDPSGLISITFQNLGQGGGTGGNYGFDSVITASLSVDTTPPILADFTFSPTTIDLSTGPATVFVTLQLTDDLSGATNAQVDFHSPSFGQFQSGLAFLSAGTPQDGTFVGEIEFPQFAESGTWTVTRIWTKDRVGNTSVVSTAVLQQRRFPTELEVLSTTDDQVPVITDLSILPNAVDVSSADQSVTIGLEVTDNLSGVAFLSLSITSPSGQQSRNLSNFSPVSGTSTDGVWEGTLNIPQFSEPGTWKINFIALTDVAGNLSFEGTTELEASGFSVDLVLTSDPADTTTPVLTGLSLLPTVINTSTADQVVQVQFVIEDDLAGADFSFSPFFDAGLVMESPSGNQRSTSAGVSFNLIAGSPLAGSWQSSLFFPQFSEDGTWRIIFLGLKDATRNLRDFSTAELEAMGFPTELVVLRPSLTGDGSVGSEGGTVEDDTFGSRAQVIFPPGAVETTTDVAIDVFLEPPDIPNPSGFSLTGTLFVNIELTPEPAFPLPSPGLQLVLPMPNPLPQGFLIGLFKVDPATGDLVPVLDVSGLPVIGVVLEDGLSAFFSGIASLSTVVGLVPDVITIADLVRRVEGLAADGSLKAQHTKPLLVKLANAQQDLDRDHLMPALNKLAALINHVNAFIRGRKLSEEDGQALIADIRKAIEFLLMDNPTSSRNPNIQEVVP